MISREKWMSQSAWEREPVFPRFVFNKERRELIRMTFWEMEANAEIANKATEGQKGDLVWELYRAISSRADEAFYTRIAHSIKHIGLQEIHFWLDLLQKSKYDVEFADLVLCLMIEAAVRLGVYKEDGDWDLPRGKWWLRKEVEK